MFLFLGLFVAVTALLWLYLRKKHSYFKDNDIHHLPTVPVFGNMGRQMLNKEHNVEYLTRIYSSFSNDRFIGMYEFMKPILMIRDPELLRLITVKDFDHFIDHRPVSDEIDPLFSQSLVRLKGQKWRDMRSTLSPAFTGSKLRGMVPLIQDCSNTLIEHLESQLKKNEDGYLDVDANDLFTRYANDVIASCAFGLKVNSIADKDNHFYKMGYKLTNFTVAQAIKLILTMIIPFLNKILHMGIVSKEATDFFKETFLSAMKYRNENNTFRPDLIQIMLEAKKGILKHEGIKDDKDAGFATVEESAIGKGAIKQVWSDEALVAQALLFFFAGFDTVATTMMFMMYELAINPDIQTKLRQEIDECHEKYQGTMDYEKLNQMRYLDNVISESLRKWPPGFAADRVCKKRYNLGRSHDKSLTDFWVEDGTVINIPIWSIHHDPKYYSEPERFDPERFSDENKHNIRPFTYMPFGLGPRNCVGSRFALTEIKTMAFDLLRNFELSPGPKTTVPAKLDLSCVTVRLLGGHWLRITPRKFAVKIK